MQAIPAAHTVIHGEHVYLLQELAKLEHGLGSLVCDSEVFADLAGAPQVEQHGQHLADWLPQHFRREEETIFRQAAQVSPQLENFCRVMRDEHADLIRRLSRLNGAVKNLQDGESVYDAIFHIQVEGRDFALRLRDHVAHEEVEFSGFL
jgi:hypothetical protein